MTLLVNYTTQQGFLRGMKRSFGETGQHWILNCTLWISNSTLVDSGNGLKRMDSTFIFFSGILDSKSLILIPMPGIPDSTGKNLNL